MKLFCQYIFISSCSSIMMILSYLVFILLLIETDSDESDSSIPLAEIIPFVNGICASIDDCKLPCCLLNEIYSIAKNRCTTNIDGQLLKEEWISPFSAVHKVSCDLVCSQHINDERRIDSQLFQSFRDAETSEDLCNNFTEVCHNYSSENIDEFAALDFFWGVLIPISTMGLAISLMIFTLFLYLVVPDLRRRIQDKCFLFYLSSRIVYLSLFFIVLFTDLEGFMCTSVGKLFLFIYYLFIFTYLFFFPIIFKCYKYTNLANPANVSNVLLNALNN